MIDNLSVLIVVVLLMVAFASPLFANKWRRIVQTVSTVVMAAAACASAVLLYRVVTSGPITSALGGWEAPWGIEVVVTPLTAFIMLTVTTIVTFVMLYVPQDQRDWPNAKVGRYNTLILLLTAALLGITMTNDMFNMYVFLEVSALASFAIVAAQKERNAADASFKYLMLGTIGSAFVFLAIGITYVVTGYLNIGYAGQVLAQGQFHPIIPWVISSFYLVGFGVKAGLFPLHIWLPDAHSSAPASASALLSGVVVKVYAVAMVSLFYGLFGGQALESLGISNLVRIAAALSILAGSAFALVQTDIKRMLAYSTVAQVGYVFLGFGLGGIQGVAAALFHVLAHGLMKSVLFLSSGKVIAVRGTRNIRGFDGVGRILPLPMITFTIAALSMVGLPILAGFATKWYLFSAGLATNLYWVPVLVLVSSLLNATYFLPIVWRIWFGETEEKVVEQQQHVPGLIPLAVILVILGIIPGPVMEILHQAAGWLIS